MSAHARARSRGWQVAIGVVVAILALLPGGVTYAWFSGAGAGGGSATAGILDPVTVQAGVVYPDAALLPGHKADVAMRLDNPNAYGVRLISVVRDITRDVTVTGNEGCTASNASLTFTDQTAMNVAIDPESVGVFVELEDAIEMGSDAANACQGVTFAIPVTITVRSP